MEMRQHPRVDIPLVVELSHATLGQQVTTARDLSDGGVFVYLKDHTLQAGATLKIRLKTTSLSDTQNTPTVDARIARVDDDGLALSFRNKTAHHLWTSVVRLRNDLRVGQDYFQAYEALVCSKIDKGILLVLQNGKWGYPGFFLKVDDDMKANRGAYLAAQLNVENYLDEGPLAVENFHHEILPEASTLCVIRSVVLEQAKISLPSESEFKDFKWVSKAKDLADLTVTSEWVRVATSERLITMGLIERD